MLSGGEARHGRRSNGLYAAEYAAVGDVDPRVGEHLLDVLGNRGIAAYLQPTVDQHPITRINTLPSRPTDRLYVDRAELSTARKFLDMVGDITDPAAAPPAPAARTSSEFEAAWASIIAGYHETAADEDAPRPGLASASTSAAPVEDPPEPTRAWPRWRGPDSENSLVEGIDRLGADLPDDDEGDFEPPPPPPLPRFAHATVAAVIGVLVGLVVIVDPDLLPMLDSSVAVVLGGLCLLTGAAALIARLRSGDDDQDDSDDGAIV
jgi:hypothetical protein